MECLWSTRKCNMLNVNDTAYNLNTMLVVLVPRQHYATPFVFGCSENWICRRKDLCRHVALPHHTRRHWQSDHKVSNLD